MTSHGAPRPAALPEPARAPCGAPRTRGRGVCRVLTPGGTPCHYHRAVRPALVRRWSEVELRRLGLVAS